MRKATFIKKLSSWNGDARLFMIDPPAFGAKFVVVSGVHVLGIPETYIFQLDEEGMVLDWSEMHGSFKGSIDHESAISGLLEAAGEEAA